MPLAAAPWASPLRKSPSIQRSIITPSIPPSICPSPPPSPQDPLADGVVIHTAATRALQHGATLDAVISMVSRVAPSLRAPLVLFTYYNPIIRRGMDTFCRQIKEAGASGARSSNKTHTTSTPLVPALAVPGAVASATSAVPHQC